MGHQEKLKKLYDRLATSKGNVSFSDLCKLAELVGFIFDRQSGSHAIYKHDKYPGIMNFQNSKGNAKPFQIKQLLNFIETHKLLK